MTTKAEIRAKATLLGIEACKLIHVQGLEGTLSYKGGNTYSEGLILWNEASIMYLDAEDIT